MAGSKAAPQLMSRKDAVKAIQAQGKLKAIEQSQRQGKKRNGRTRPSISAWVAALAPIFYFIAGVPGISAGAAVSGTLTRRLQRGLESLLVAYTGFSFDGKFRVRGLAFGWTPIIFAIAVRKMKINRQVARGAPFIY